MDKLIATIRKFDRTEVRIEISEFKEQSFVNIRTWVRARDSEEMIPTRKGVTVTPEQLPELIEALQAAERDARAGGLLK